MHRETTEKPQRNTEQSSENLCASPFFLCACLCSKRKRAMKAIILAAGSSRMDSTTPWVLQPLGDRPLLDYVVELASQVVKPDDLIVVVDGQDNAITAHLGPDYHYVVQHQQHGTGHAVLQAQTAIIGYDGPLLILYGDTALLRASSVLGLLTRHQLKQAALTLLAATTDQLLPYGRIIRNAQGAIVDVVEAHAATQAEQQIKELNIGAYVVEAATLWPALRAAEEADANKQIDFTAAIHIRSSAASTASNANSI